MVGTELDLMPEEVTAPLSFEESYRSLRLGGHGSISNAEVKKEMTVGYKRLLPQFLDSRLTGNNLF